MAPIAYRIQDLQKMSTAENPERKALTIIAEALQEIVRMITASEIRVNEEFNRRISELESRIEKLEGNPGNGSQIQRLP